MATWPVANDFALELKKLFDLAVNKCKYSYGAFDVQYTIYLVGYSNV